MKKLTATLGLAVLILLLAAFLRLHDVGDYPFTTDEATHSLLAMQIGQFGNFHLEGPPMSVGRRHSPFSMYVYALPFAISPDPRLARMWTGLLNVIAAAAVYAIGARAFSKPAGLIAALLYAVHPQAVAAARFIWNPQLGAPFAMLYLFTGLVGYLDGRRWAQIAHPVCLALAAQCHPMAALLAPTSLLLWGYAAWHDRRKWHRYAALAGISVGIGLLFLLPWLVTLKPFSGAGEPFSFLPNRGLAYLWQTQVVLLGTWRSDLLQVIQPVLTYGGAVWLVIRGLSTRRGFAGLVVALFFFLIPALGLLFDLPYRDYHIWPAFGAAFLIQGAVLGSLLQFKPAAGALRAKQLWPLRSAIVLLVVILSGAHLLAFRTRNEVYNWDVPSLNAHLRLLGEAVDRAAEKVQGVLILTRGEPDQLPWEALAAWARITQGADVRVVWSGHGIPLPDAGAVLIGYEKYADRPDLFRGGMVEDHLRVVALPPARELVAPTFNTPAPIRFANGAALVGLAPATPGEGPTPGTMWPVYSFWRFDAITSDSLIAYGQLFDSSGMRYASADQPALAPANWRPGETVLLRWELAVQENLPHEGPLTLQAGMYILGGTETIPLLNPEGSPAADRASIMVRGAAEPLTWLSPEVAVDALRIGEPVVQGPPLAIRSTWRTSASPARDLTVHWRLLDTEGNTVYEHHSEVVPGVPLSSWPADVLTEMDYLLRVPTDLPAGDYLLELALVDSGGNPAGAALQQMLTVGERARSMTLSADLPDTPDTRFGSAIWLRSYEIQAEDSTLTVRLAWQPDDYIFESLTYFVHVLHDGALVAQHDSLPGSGAYPTDWWAPGEFINETITIDISGLEAGEYVVTTGFYRLASGERLLVARCGATPSEDALELGSFVR